MYIIIDCLVTKLKKTLQQRAQKKQNHKCYITKECRRRFIYTELLLEPVMFAHPVLIPIYDTACILRAMLCKLNFRKVDACLYYTCLITFCFEMFTAQLYENFLRKQATIQNILQIQDQL